MNKIISLLMIPGLLGASGVALAEETACAKVDAKGNLNIQCVTVKGANYSVVLTHHLISGNENGYFTYDGGITDATVVSQECAKTDNDLNIKLPCVEDPSDTLHKVTMSRVPDDKFEFLWAVSSTGPLSNKIPNSNPWIKPNQSDYFSLDNFNPDYRESVESGKDLSEFGDISITVKLTLRRALDEFESGLPYKLRDFSSYKNSQELLYLSYKDLNSYVSSLDDKELTEVYGASPWDIQSVKDYLKINNIDVSNDDINLERRTIEFKVSAEEFENTFTNGNLIYDANTGNYINKNLDTSDSSLYAQGDLSELFSEALIGFEPSIDSDQSNVDTTNDVSKVSKVSKVPKVPKVPVITSFYPQEIGSAYNFPSLKDSSGGAGVRIGLVGSGGNQAMLKWQQSSQYQQYLRNQGIDPDSVPPVKSLLTREPNGSESVEQMLDISVLTSIAPNAQIYASKTDDYAELIYRKDLDIDIISSSIGAFPTGAYTSESFEELSIDALLRGITVVIAAGDQGTLNIESEKGKDLFPFGEPMANASDGNAAVLSVGGTSFSPELNISPFVDLDATRNMVVGGSAYDSLTGLIDDQSMWNGMQFENVIGGTFVPFRFLGSNTIGSSGKWSSDDPVLNAGYQKHNLGDDMDGYARKYPDISVLAGGNTENGTINRYTIVTYDESTDSYKFGQSGGTSAGAPLTAGLLAVIAGDLKKQNGSQSKIGFINPLLYEGYASDRRDDLFIDVPAGSNNANVFKIVDEANWDGNFYTQIGEISYPLMGTGPGGSLDTSLSQTGTGFDDASGLGSLNGNELLDYLMKIHSSM